MTLSREQLLERTKAKVEEVTPKGWTEPVKIRQLKQGEYKRIYATIDEKDPFGTMPPLLIASLVNEDGSQMFADEDVDKIQEMSAAEIVNLVDAINKVNHFEAPEKNS